MGVVASPNIDASVNAALGEQEFTCLSSLSTGDLVYIDGSSVLLVDRTDDSKMPAVGVVVSKRTSTTATVRFLGPVEDIYTGLTIGAEYFVGSNGRPAFFSLNPSEVAFCQPIGFATSSTVLYLRPDNKMSRQR